MDSNQVHSFLAEPLRMAQVAAVSPTGIPLLGSLWFLFEQNRFWFSSHPSSPLVKAAANAQPVAVMVDQFDPPDQIRQVRVRGPAQTEPHDAARVQQIYARYLGEDQVAWPDFFRTRARDPGWTLWSVTPDSGLASALPGFRGEDVRWTSAEDSPF